MSIPLSLKYFINCKKLFLIVNVFVLILNIHYFYLINTGFQKYHLNEIRYAKPFKNYKSYVTEKNVINNRLLKQANTDNLNQPKILEFNLTSKYVKNSEHLPTDESEYNQDLPKLEIFKPINCELIIQGNEDEILKAKTFMQRNPKVPIYEETYLEWTKNCSKFKKERGYIETSLSDEERYFPLAFSISTYKDAEQTERLLRAIYQPQNLYCIHVDIKSSLLFHNTIRSITNCFHNVWIASSLYKIKWGDASVVMPEMSCMKDLLKYFRGHYKYFINLTGQEFPLRTNLELVRISKIFNGSNDITGSYLKMDLDRVKYVWKHRWSKTYQQTILYNTLKEKKSYEYSNLTFYKGEVHGLFAHKMTEFIVESKHGKMFFEWCKDTGHASEHYWNTLNYNKIFLAPGGYEGDPLIADQYSTHPIVRAKNWVNMNNYQWPCNGKVVRGICIYGIDDIVWLSRRPEMFINKFHLTYEHIGYDCLEEKHRNNTNAKHNPIFNEDIYKNLPTVKYSRKNGL